MPSVVLGDFPEPDKIEGANHPRATQNLIGHADAHAHFLQAFNSDRLHHAWMISGPKGVGKATLAYKIARFLLASSPSDSGMFAPPKPVTLNLDLTAHESAMFQALSHPRLYLLRIGLNDRLTALATRIGVDEVRKMTEFFHLSATEGGRRVAVIDDLDMMTPQAANAFLKLLEEPPANVTFLLITHQPARLLPTIRSRCRELRLGPLSPQDLSDALTAAGGDVAPEDRVALAQLAGGSVGRAFELTNLDGLRLYQSLIDLLGGLPRLDRPRAQSMAEAAAGKGAEAQFELIIALIDLFLARTARASAMGGLAPDAARGEGALIGRLAANPASARLWAEMGQVLGNKARRGRAVNLDPAALVLDMLLAIEAGARDMPNG
jgi:DNA polymerase-3 subunit delta'